MMFIVPQQESASQGVMEFLDLIKPIFPQKIWEVWSSLAIKEMTISFIS